MKVFVCVNNYGEGSVSKAQGWYLLVDSAISNTGKPFYLPDGSGGVAVSLSAAIRVERLGKLIAPKFASRYFSEFAPALHFTLPQLGEKLRREGLPEDPSRNFDRSLFVGDFRCFDSDAEIQLQKNGETEASFKFHHLISPPEKIISEISVMNTMKMGDIVLPGLSGKVNLEIGDLLEVKINGEKAFHVKVK